MLVIHKLHKLQDMVQVQSQSVQDVCAAPYLSCLHALCAGPVAGSQAPQMAPATQATPTLPVVLGPGADVPAVAPSPPARTGAAVNDMGEAVVGTPFDDGLRMKESAEAEMCIPTPGHCGILARPAQCTWVGCTVCTQLGQGPPLAPAFR